MPRRGYIIIENTYRFVSQLQRSGIDIFMSSSCKKQYTERHGGICFFGFGIAKISLYIVTLSAWYYVAPTELTLHNSYLCYYYFAPTELGFYQFLGENAIPLAPQGLHHNRKYIPIRVSSSGAEQIFVFVILKYLVFLFPFYTYLCKPISGQDSRTATK